MNADPDEHMLPRLLNLNKHNKDTYIDNAFLVDDEIGLLGDLHFDNDNQNIGYESPLIGHHSLYEKKDFLFVHNDNMSIFDNSSKINVSDFLLSDTKTGGEYKICQKPLANSVPNYKNPELQRPSTFLDIKGKTVAQKPPPNKKQKTKNNVKTQDKSKDCAKKPEHQKRRCVKSTSCYRGVTHHCRTGRWESHICTYDLDI